MKTFLAAFFPVILTGCVSVSTSPTTAEQVAAATLNVGGDGYIPVGVGMVGPAIAVGDGAWARLLYLGPGDDFALDCALSFKDRFNSMNSAFAEGGIELKLTKPNRAAVARIADNMESFILRLPRELVTQKRQVGIRLKVYGTRNQREVSIPAWYVAGFLKKCEP